MEKHAEIQNTAKIAMEALIQAVRPGVTEKELVKAVADSFAAQGIDHFWYHGLPVLLFAGPDRTILSQAACDYAPTDYQIQENDMITADLAPEKDRIWGDYARTIIVENGKVVPHSQIQNPEWREGVEAENKLHAHLVESAKPEMTFRELHAIMDEYLHGLGFKNLDFLSNFGHDIVDGMDSDKFYELVNDPRVFFDAKCDVPIGDRFFTFEPHIAKPDGHYGYKREDIYHFVDGKLVAL